MSAARLSDALRRHRGVAFLCVGIFASSLGMGVISPVFPLFVDEEFHLTSTQIALAVGLLGVGRIFTSLPAGYLTQRYGRRMVLVLGTATNFIGAAMVPFSFSYAWLLLWRMISGLSSSMFTTGVSVYLRDASTPKTRGRFLSLHELSILVGQSIGPAIGGLVGEGLGLRAPLFLQAVLIFVALVVIAALVPETKPVVPGTGESQKPSSKAGIRRASPPSMLRTYRTLILSSGFIMVGLLNLMVVTNRQGGRFTIMPLYGETKGFTPTELGVFFSITHIPQFFTTLASGIASDRFGRKLTVVPATALIALGILLFIRSSTVAELLVSGVLLGLGEGLIGPPVVAFFADIAPPGQEGITMGLFRTFGGVGSLLGVLLMGGVADVLGFGWSLGVDAILLGAVALGVMAMVRETAGRRTGRPENP